jgi:hypothetical protein
MRINRAFPNVILFLENDPSTEVLEALEAVAFPLRWNVYRSGGADREAGIRADCPEPNGCRGDGKTRMRSIAHNSPEAHFELTRAGLFCSLLSRE